MNKILTNHIIFEKRYDGWISGIPFSDLPKDLLPDDMIDIEKHEAYYESDCSNDAETYLYIYRLELETDEEFEKRKKKVEKMAVESKERRYEQYLKLKKEFENICKN